MPSIHEEVAVKLFEAALRNCHTFGLDPKHMLEAAQLIVEEDLDDLEEAA